MKDKESLVPSRIKNKEKRWAVHAKLKHEKKKKAKAREAEEKRALELGEEPPQKQTPRTIENTRELDETVCKPDDDELFAGNDADEFSSILKQDYIPKVLITTARFHSTGPDFIKDLLSIIPNAHYHKRGTYDLKKIVQYARNKDFSSLIVVRREPDALVIIGLPDGPTAHFKLSNLVLHKDLKFLLIIPCKSYILETKESKQPESKGKDKKDKEKVIGRLQECGPWFSLKLISLQKHIYIYVKANYSCAFYIFSFQKLFSEWIYIPISECSIICHYDIYGIKDAFQTMLHMKFIHNNELIIQNVTKY